MMASQMSSLTQKINEIIGVHLRHTFHTSGTYMLLLTSRIFVQEVKVYVSHGQYVDWSCPC